MGQLERVFFFHQEIEKGRYPNSRRLAEQFEVSTATAKRDISYLRDRLLAPLAFDHQHNGYFYQQADFQLPFADSPRIVFLLAMVSRLAEEAGLDSLREVKQLAQRLSAMIAPDYQKIVASLYCQRIETEAIDHEVFETVLAAIARDRLLTLGYRATGGGETTRRVVPLRVINYQGRWYLLGHCLLRKARRLFHLARIQQARLDTEGRPADQIFDLQVPDGSFGIFLGEPRYRAEILFTGTAAALVRNQYWHRDQETAEVKEGLILQLPVSDDREIVMKILQYGAMARVLQPPELIARLRQEIERMTALYPQSSGENAA